MTVFRIVTCIDVEAPNASAAYEKLHDALMPTELPWETTDEWYDEDEEGGEPMLLEDIEAAIEDFAERRGSDE